MVKRMKEPHKIGYKIFLTILKPIYKLYYHPRIINKEVIPTEGPVIICSNHLHLFDQNTALLSTKRMIHYMAKKEHLDGKFGWFFKTVGCIRVDREIHDETAKSEAINLLKNGYIVGLFPEGTRNQVFGKEEINKKLYKLYQDELSYKDFIKTLKNNQVCISELNLLDKLLADNRITLKEYKENALNIYPYLEQLLENNIITKKEYASSQLLPIKFGAVSLAAKTGATIVPCAVTGKYTFKDNHLNLRFGTPFKVENITDLEEYRNKLEQEIINLKLEGLEDIKNNRI